MEIRINFENISYGQWKDLKQYFEKHPGLDKDYHLQAELEPNQNRAGTLTLTAGIIIDIERAHPEMNTKIKGIIKELAEIIGLFQYTEEGIPIEAFSTFNANVEFAIVCLSVPVETALELNQLIILDYAKTPVEILAITAGTVTTMVEGLTVRIKTTIDEKKKIRTPRTYLSRVLEILLP
jgi:hypothetical protein